MVRYINILNDLETTLNFKSTNEAKAKLNKQIFSNALNILKDDFKTDVSTKFLMGFVVGTNKQKSGRVDYLLESCGLVMRWGAIFSFDEKALTTTGKNVEVCVYSKKIDKDKKEQIYLKVVPMTSTDGNGISMPCKVGVTGHKRNVTTLHNVTL